MHFNKCRFDENLYFSGWRCSIYNALSVNLVEKHSSAGRVCIGWKQINVIQSRNRNAFLAAGAQSVEECVRSIILTTES